MIDYEPEEVEYGIFIKMINDVNSGTKFFTTAGHHKFFLMKNGRILFENTSAAINYSDGHWTCHSDWAIYKYDNSSFVKLVKIDEMIRSISVEHKDVASWFLFNLKRFA